MNILVKCIKNDIDKVGEGFPLVEATLETVYLIELENKQIDSILKIGNKSTDRMLLEQPGWLQFYYMKYTELSTALSYIDTKMDEIKSDTWKDLTEKNNRELTHNDKNQYVLQNVQYRRYKRLYWLIEEVAKYFNVVVESLKSQGYILSAYYRSPNIGET